MRRRRISRDELFIKTAQLVAQRSTCLRSQVGALIVKDGRIISMGYNGPTSKAPHCEQYPDDVKGHAYSMHKFQLEHPMVCQGPGCVRSLHAETNAIAYAARTGIAVEGATMYCTMSPCIHCAKVIVNSGIREFQYMTEYRDKAGLEFLMKSGIIVGHMDGPGWELGEEEDDV